MLATFEQLAAHMRSNLDAASAYQALWTASAMVTRRTGQQFLPGTSTETIALSGGQWLFLPQRPVVEVASVSIGAQPVADYVVVGDRLFRYGGWRGAWNAPPVVTVTYSHGGDVPDDVIGAVLAVAADVYGNPANLISETVGEYTYRLSGSGKSALDEIAKAYPTFAVA